MCFDKLPSDCIMSASSLFSSVTVAESPLHIRMGFLRKYFGIIAAQSILISLLSSVIMLSPIARFYITENDWVLFAVCFLFFATYFSLFHLIKMTVIDILLLLHIGVQALTIGVIVTYYDLMFLLQAILLSTWTIFVIFLYTLQSKRDCNIWVILIISSICIILASALLRAVFGGTNEENILSVLITVLFLVYQTYGVFTICKILTPTDCILAVVNMHLLPINVLVFSTAVNKPPM